MARTSLYNAWVFTVICFAGYSYGFGFSVFVTTIGQPGFYRYFNLDPTTSYTAHILDATNSLFNFGAAFGALAQSPIADKYGSVHVGMMITVRLFQGFGLGMIFALVPLYLNEVAPPRQRGLIARLTVLSFGTGYFVCSWIAVGIFNANETFQWRGPLGLACISPLLLLLTLPTVPETPRYLIWTEKKEKAWDVLRRLHHNPDDPEDRQAHAEFTQIVLQVEHDREMKVGWIQIFKVPSLRRRALLCMFLIFATPSTGIIGISNYLPLIFGGLGLGGILPLVMYGIWTTLGTSMALVSIVIVDRVGRRTLLVWGYPVLAVLLLIQAVLQSQFLGTDNRGGLATCLVFLFIYIVTFQLIDAPAFIWASEIWPTAYRAKGISLGFFAFFVGSLTYTTPSALAFGNIAWRMYLLYMGLCIVCGAIIFFFIKETQGLPMEELAGLFGDEVVVHMTKDGTGIVEKGNLDKVAAFVGTEHIETLGSPAPISEDGSQVRAQQTKLQEGV
ncbi:hypothetical protein H2200_012308 [Cladophialophora chaetospira]|uniref:Major facilitator superfamily (MFS) profile domain-containing protein n=1 Tax=Cladophialophora chaetospira TaxID=386627 RepID=A0AA38WXK5_9EURO|nr:hypothetical protein H2200_012308 [Cladophialophora chaetospira]